MLSILWAVLKIAVSVTKCLCSILWEGIKTVFTSRRKTMILFCGVGALYGLNLFITDLSIAYKPFAGWWETYLFIYVFGINGGIGRRIKHYLYKKKYMKLFESIKFISTDHFYPGYIDTRSTENMKIISFYSTIPLNTWIKNQALLESAFNCRFYEISDRPYNNRIIDISILLKALPNVITWEDGFIDKGDILNIGEGYHGRVGINLRKQPHAFIAGETGSGKSIILQCMIYQALKKGYQVKLIDFKRGVSFAGFSGLVDLVVELEQADTLLSGLIHEVNKRLDLFVAEGVQDIKDYNQKVGKTGGNRLQRIIVVVDELAELVDAGGADKEEKAVIQSINRNLRTLARIARAPGVHLLLGIQRPDSSIIDGQIKSNIPFRMCGHFADPQASIIVLGNSKATQLPNIPGRFIINNQEVQAYYFTLQPQQLADFCPTQARIRRIVQSKTAIETTERPIPTAPRSTKTDAKNGLDLDFSDDL